jgi:hypothetical protein
MRSALELHKDLIAVPLPLRDLAHTARTAYADLGGRHRREAVHLLPDVLMAHVGSTLVKQVSSIAKRQRKAKIRHDRALDDPWRCLERAKWIFAAFNKASRRVLPAPSPGSPDNIHKGHSISE